MPQSVWFLKVFDFGFKWAQKKLAKTIRDSTNGLYKGENIGK